MKKLSCLSTTVLKTSQFIQRSRAAQSVWPEGHFPFQELQSLPSSPLSFQSFSTESTAPTPHPAGTSPGPLRKLQVAGIEKIIAVASGKGGVGKSTVAVNLAVSFARHCGLRVGLLDADVYGPSIPRMMGLTGRPQVNAEKKMVPLENHGVRCMSMGFLMADGAPAVWRGPMVMSALEQMVRGTAWGHLDVLVIDMPPGTGDAQISITQRLPLAGAVIVSTPQDIALIDARRGANMFAKVNVQILGVIETMSYFQCPKCGERAEIFGHGGARECAREMGMEFLGEIPLNILIRQTSDDGRPVASMSPQAEEARAFADIAKRLVNKLEQAQDSQPPVFVTS